MVVANTISMLAGAALALVTFSVSALLASMTPAVSAPIGVAVHLGGFIARIGFVAAALVLSVRLLHLSPLPLSIGLAGAFTACAGASLLLEWQRRRLPATRH